MKILIGTNNAHKAQEIRDMLPGIEIVRPKDIGLDLDVDENGKSFEEAIAAAKQDIEQIVNNPAAPDFENTVVALDRAGEQLSTVADLFCNLDFGAARAQCGGCQQRGHLGAVLFVEVDVAIGVGLGLLDELGRFLGRCAQHD